MTIAGGVAANPFFKKLYRCLEPYNVFVESIPVENRFSGGTSMWQGWSPAEI